MLNAKIAIVGGGLSGLYAATLLEQRGIHDYVILESRSRLGGRIESQAVEGHTSTNRFDLGATWFWPEMQPKLSRLIDELNLTRIRQNENGNLLLDRTRTAAPVRVPNYPSFPASERLAGGMASLTEALQQGIAPGQIFCNHPVQHIEIAEDHIELDLGDATGLPKRLIVKGVLLAVPPRLVVETIKFTPNLPDDLMHGWRNTATWMAPHAKYVAVFEEAFWRTEGLSGAARSSVGPLVEIHDASALDGDAALFGFIGMPADTRRKLDKATLLAHCRAQLVRLFGDRAIKPKAEYLKDWSSDPLTATVADRYTNLDHVAAPYAVVVNSPWRERVIGIASEWSPSFPGYLAGAIDAATWGVEKLLAMEF
jgi:monoamine oxidase